MTRSLKNKLILSYLVIALITILVVSVYIRMTSGQSLMNLVVEQQTAVLNESVKNYYSAYETMDGFYEYYKQSFQPEPGEQTQPENQSQPNEDADFQPEPDAQPDEKNYPPPPSRDIRGLHGLMDADFIAIIPTFDYQIGEFIPEERRQNAIPVELDEETIAWIIPDNKFQFTLSNEEQLFLQRTNTAIGIAALAGVVLAVIMGFIFAGGLLKPIRLLIAASKSLARGNLQQQVPVTSQDELGQLTKTFNTMSADLYRADQQRKRMTADITHDLGTPLQIISGYMEMLESGEVTLTPARIEIIKTEIDHLRGLVGDLTMLTQVEGGGLEFVLLPSKPSSLFTQIYKTWQPIATRQEVDLVMIPNEEDPAILVDEARILQVLKNLVENALRYTPRGGTITLHTRVDEQVHLCVTDSGTGIEPEDLPYVFERFYRADSARGFNSGKMGLGLAICKALVTAQGGTISVTSEGKNKGTTMIISFDMAPEENPSI